MNSSSVRPCSSARWPLLGRSLRRSPAVLGFTHRCAEPRRRPAQHRGQRHTPPAATEALTSCGVRGWPSLSAQDADWLSRCSHGLRSVPVLSRSSRTAWSRVQVRVLRLSLGGTVPCNTTTLLGTSPGVASTRLEGTASASPQWFAVTPCQPCRCVQSQGLRRPLFQQPNPSLKRSPNSRPRYSAATLSLPRGLLLRPA